jgi:hypothetical protein
MIGLAMSYTRLAQSLQAMRELLGDGHLNRLISR